MRKEEDDAEQLAVSDTHEELLAMRKSAGSKLYGRIYSGLSASFRPERWTLSLQRSSCQPRLCTFAAEMHDVVTYLSYTADCETFLRSRDGSKNLPILCKACWQLRAATNGVLQSIHFLDPFGGSFSAVSKPNFARLSKYSFESS